jgi:hypothetical protein
VLFYVSTIDSLSVSVCGWFAVPQPPIAAGADAASPLDKYVKRYEY